MLVEVWTLPLEGRGTGGEAEPGLRRILARAAACAPDDLVLDAEPGGKPLVAAPDPQIHFSLSHTQGLAVVAVTRGCRVGVDVEHVSGRERWPSLAERWFTEAEREGVDSLEAFLRVWVRKEALVKGTGDGLGGIRRVDGTAPPEGWTLRDLAAPAGYVAALAVEGTEPLEVRGPRDLRA